jgi:hypothetical protein
MIRALTGEQVCEACLEEQGEHATRACFKCGGPVCDDVTMCEVCGWNECAAQEAQKENNKALGMLFYPTFFKEVEEAKLAMRPFAVCGTAALPPAMVYVKPMEGEGDLQGREQERSHASEMHHAEIILIL